MRRAPLVQRNWLLIAISLYAVLVAVADYFTPASMHLLPLMYLAVVAFAALTDLIPAVVFAIFSGALAVVADEGANGAVWNSNEFINGVLVALVSVVIAVVVVKLRAAAAETAQLREKGKFKDSIERSEQLYRTIGEFIPFGVWHVGADEKLKYISPSYLEMMGMTLDELASGGWLERVPEEDRAQFLKAWERRETVDGLWESEYRVRGADGTLHQILSRGTRMADIDGSPMGWVGVSFDITERKKATDRLDFLAEAGRLLSLSLNPDTTLERLAQLCVPALADRCSIDILQDDGSIKTLVALHADPNKAGSATELRENFAPEGDESRASTRVIRTGEAEFDPEVTDALRAMGVKSKIVVPLTARGRTIAALTLAYAESNRRYSDADLELVKLLGQRSALAYDNARLYHREHRVAEALQRATLPTDLPQVLGVVIHATYRAGASESEVGGDWYDAFELPNGDLILSVGDVAGKGLKAAVAMGSARQALRAAAFEGADPAAALQRANKLLCYEGADMVTAAVARIDVDKGTVEYATAGHPALLLADREGAIKALSSRGIPLAIAADYQYAGRAADMTAGSLLVLYTDGLIEFDRDIASGERSLYEAVRDETANPSPDTARSIAARILTKQPSDDVAVLTLQMASDRFNELDVTMPALPTSARMLRRNLRRLGNAFGLSEERTFRLLVASGEAVSNVIEHAYGLGSGTVRVKAYRENGAVVAEIHDTGRWRAPRVETGHGRGLELMRELMDDVEVQSTDYGTVIRQRLSLSDVR